MSIIGKTTQYQILTQLKKLGILLHVWHPKLAVQKAKPRTTQLGVNALYHGDLYAQRWMDTLQSFKTPLCRAGIDNVDKFEALLEVLQSLNSPGRITLGGRPI